MSHHLPSIAHRTLAAFTLASSGFVSFASAAIITVCPDGSCNFTTPVAAVTAAVSGDTIQISAGTYMLDSTISLLNKQLVIRGAVDAAGHPATVLNAGGTRQIFSFSVIGNTTSIENLVITNGRADHGGAMFFDGANPVFRNCAIQNNRATFHGGAIYLNDSSPTFIYCELTDNRTITQGAGGAIFVSAGTPTINSCSLTGNTSSDGGAIFLSSSGRVNLQSTRVCGNSASIDPQIGMNTGGIVNDLDNSCVANDCAACPPPQNCHADFDGNRVVNGLDFSILLSSWGTCSGCASDINRDELVDGLDLAAMLGGWGFCTSPAQNMEHKGINIDDTTAHLRPSYSTISQYWHLTEKKAITNIRTFKYNVHGAAWVKWAVENNIKVIVGIDLNYYQAEIDCFSKDYLASTSLKAQYDANVLAIAVGNEETCVPSIISGITYAKTKPLPNQIKYTSVLKYNLEWQTSDFPPSNCTFTAKFNTLEPHLDVLCFNMYGGYFTYGTQQYITLANSTSWQSTSAGGSVLLNQFAAIRFAMIAASVSKEFWVTETGWCSTVDSHIKHSNLAWNNIANEKKYYQGFLGFSLSIQFKPQVQNTPPLLAQPPERIFYFSLRDVLNGQGGSGFGLYTSSRTLTPKF